MRYEHILTAFYATPLALLPEKARAIARLLHARAAGGGPTAEEVAEIVAARRPDGVQLVGRVAVLPVFGVLSQRVGMMEEASGGVSCEKVGAALDSLVADRGVKCVVLAFDSPGGSVFGVGELAAKIRSARDEKKVIGLADSMAASAAYWLLSQCSEVNVTPGGQVGSIGVFAAHEDISGQQEEEGVKTTLVSAGKYKTEGSPYGPLTDEAKAELQSKVDHYYGVFTADVAKGRGATQAKVKSDFGEGRMVTAADAVSRGMADRVATLEQVLKRQGAYDGGPAASTSLAAARARAAAADQ